MWKNAETLSMRPHVANNMPIKCANVGGGLTRTVVILLRLMCFAHNLSHIFGVLFGPSGLGSVASGNYLRQDCSWRHNITDINKMTSDEVDVLENCLYYYLLQRESSRSNEFGIGSGAYHALHTPPMEFPLRLSIDQFVVRQVVMPQKSSPTEFRIHGDLILSWNDSRLMWNETEWKMESYELHDSHHIWTPSFSDESTCGSPEGCLSKSEDVELHFDGKVTARISIKYPAFCRINFRRYPEETNDCCMYLTAANADRLIKYSIQTKERTSVFKQVEVGRLEKSGSGGGGDGAHALKFKDDLDPILSNVETSVWAVEDRSVTTIRIDGLRSEYIQLCVHAKKEMSTLKIALRIPVTIATMLMLVSPLFGDLRTQAFVKLLTLTLQTMCFLFLCSIAPPTGFGGSKPKIYTFYEFMFVLTFMSILITLVCLALSRVRRTVPASHSLYLSAKVINHFLCCIEPDSSAAYQRHLEDETNSNHRGGFGMDGSSTNSHHHRSGGDGMGDLSHHAMSHDYTAEWRQIYVAANNLFSGMCFSIFCFVIIFEIM